MNALKQAIVRKVSRKIEEYKVVGVLNLENMPSRQLQKIKASLPAEIIVAPKNLITLSLNNSKKKGIEKLKEYLEGQTALIFSNENPFRLSSELEKNKAPAPCKGGETAPNDIAIEAGETPFAPGPMLGELKAVGLKVGVDGGKIVIKEGKKVLNAGETIEPKLADILTRLGIEPLEIGLDLKAAYEDGLIFGTDVLKVDKEEYLRKLQSAYSSVFSLTIEIAYPTKDNIEILLRKCFQDSKALAGEADILTGETVLELLAKASAEASNLKEMISEEKKEKAEKESQSLEVK